MVERLELIRIDCLFYFLFGVELAGKEVVIRFGLSDYLGKLKNGVFLWEW
jgi:hypothetical protein